MNRCSTLLTIRKRKIKTTTSLHAYQNGWRKLKIETIQNEEKFFIHNSQKLKIDQMCYLYTYHGILLSNKRI